MARQKFNVCAPIATSTGGTFWHTIGMAWETDKGGISITLNSLPLGGKIMLFPSDPAKDTSKNTKNIGLGPFDPPDDPNDDIPF